MVRSPSDVLVEVIVGSSVEILLKDVAEMEGKGLAIGVGKSEVDGIGEKNVEERNVGITNGVEDIDGISVAFDAD